MTNYSKADNRNPVLGIQSTKSGLSVHTKVPSDNTLTNLKKDILLNRYGESVKTIDLKKSPNPLMSNRKKTDTQSKSTWVGLPKSRNQGIEGWKTSWEDHDSEINYGVRNDISDKSQIM